MITEAMETLVNLNPITRGHLGLLGRPSPSVAPSYELP